MAEENNSSVAGDHGQPEPSKQGEVKSGFNGNREKPVKCKGDEKKGTVPFFKLFSFAGSTDIMLMVMGTIGAFGNGLGMPLLTILTGQVIDAFGQSHSNKQLVDSVSKVALRFLYLALGSGIAASLGERQAANIRSLYLKTVLRQDISYFDQQTNTGEVIERLCGDTVLIQDAISDKVGKFLQQVVTFFASFVIAFARAWQIALVMVSVIPLLVVAGALLSHLTGKMATRGQAAYATAATLVEQTIGSISTVASFTGERRAISMYNNFLAAAYKSGVREGLVSGLGRGMVGLIVYFSYSLAVWFGAKMILEKGYTGGQVINVIVAVVIGSVALGEASPCLSAFSNGRAAAYKMFETINRKPEIDAYDTSGRILDDLHGDIELRDVYFSYPARPNEQIFSGFSLFIPSGRTTALVGHSGSGKSTVISLIDRFYDPQAGEVLIDGINLKEFQLKWIREKIGLVSQEPVLFASTIKDNIAYGKNGATMEEIRTVAELANAAKFIDKLPKGFDTLVGEHGTQLSGGQKQRIAIARAILKDPRILLLDEATSALDAQSERIVQDALDRIMINRTTVIVAHRLTTVKNADMIAVFHCGKIVAKGTHFELLEDPDGAYSQLVSLQEMDKRLEPAENANSKQGIKTKKLRQSRNMRSLPQSSGGAPSNGSPNPLSFSPILPISSGVTDTTLKVSAEIPPVEKATKSPIWRLAYLNKPEIPILIVGTIAATAHGTVTPIFGILLSKAIKTFFEPPHELRQDSKFWALMFVTLALATFLVSTTSTYMFSTAGFKLIQRIRSMCFEKVVNMEIGWFDEPEHSSGTICARLSTDAALVRSLAGDQLATLVHTSATIVAAAIIAITACWQLALVILAIIPLIGSSVVGQRKFMNGTSADSKMMYEKASQVATDAVGSIRTIASFCAEDKVMQLYRKKCEGPLKYGVRLGFISGCGFGLSLFFIFAFFAISFYVGALLVAGGHTTPADVLQVFFALTMASLGIAYSGWLTSDTSKAKEAAVSIFSIIDGKSKIDPSDELGAKLEDVKGEIKLQHVSFTYPSRPDAQIFRDLSLVIHSGKTVALVGESGSGKSTVIALLQRFYDPDSGHITLDGIEIRQLQLKWLRQQMSLVSQEPVLFNDTIRENIAYGKGGDATETEIVAAAELASAHQFISGLQHGYNSLVGERGVQLSGGQKQRVAIARALVKNPKILLLDEATSALDSESERVVQAALERAAVNRTTVVVAHRLSTIKNADLIAVVKNGTIAEEGTHKSLIKIKDGVYASLVVLHATSKTT
ncbi:ABC transporter B member 11 [Turnera subulata]|uniref:ABC transporter B member 11 n=1 Tax=Turnera subulata TaxID=218843 RepID=A0A9Q0JL91_9ROSI|nr:ABC transporter B member 11 [Turnera subulata]